MEKKLIEESSEKTLLGKLYDDKEYLQFLATAEGMNYLNAGYICIPASCKTCPPVKYFTDRSKAALFLRIFLCFFFCLVFVMPLCASVYLCLVVTCWERAALLALVCGV